MASLPCLIALLEHILSEVIDWVDRVNAPNVDHALGKDGDDGLHKELSHVMSFPGGLQLVHVCGNHVETPISQRTKVILLLLFGFSRLFLLAGDLLLSLDFFLGQGAFTLAVERPDGAEVVEGAAVALDVDAHALKHLEFVAVVVDLEHLGLVLLEEPVHGVVGRGRTFE